MSSLDPDEARRYWLAAIELCESSLAVDSEWTEEIVKSVPNRTLLLSALIGVIGPALRDAAATGDVRAVLERLKTEEIDSFTL